MVKVFTETTLYCDLTSCQLVIANERLLTEYLLFMRGALKILSKMLYLCTSVSILVFATS